MYTCQELVAPCVASACAGLRRGDNSGLDPGRQWSSTSCRRRMQGPSLPGARKITSGR